MAREDALHMLSGEFKLWGVKMSHRHLDGGHIQLSWQATPDKELRTYVIPTSGSDHRGWLNARADIRRFFKHDGLKIEAPVRKPTLVKALSLPTPVETDREQIQALRSEVADLTDLILELVSKLAPVQMAVPQVQAPAVEQPHSQVHRSVKVREFLPETGWITTQAAAKAMDVPYNIAYRKLYYLVKTGEAELNDGRWRRAGQSKFTVVS